MASQGPNFTAGWTGNFAIQPWLVPPNAQFSDDVYTSCSMLDGTGSDLLLGRAWGFAIPAAATINGVLVEVERKYIELFPGSDCEDGAIQLWRNNLSGLVGDNKQSGIPWPQVDTFISYGGAADLWGLALTPAIINNVEFGFGMTAEAFATDLIAQVDCVRMTVFYTDASGGAGGLLMGVW